MLYPFDDIFWFELFFFFPMIKKWKLLSNENLYSELLGGPFFVYVCILALNIIAVSCRHLLTILVVKATRQSEKVDDTTKVTKGQ